MFQSPEFKIIGANPVKEWLLDNQLKMQDIILDSYRQNKKGAVENPDSYFLRFKGEPSNRIIALPAAINEGNTCSGIKWIASFPENVGNGLDRASSVIVVNDRNTGYPIACIEGSQISAVRTAAVGVLGAQHLHPTKNKIKKMAVVGSGLIAFNTIKMLIDTGWDISELVVIDKDIERGNYFSKKVGFSNVSVSTDIGSISGADLILFATSATVPFVTDPSLFSHNPTVLHISLRDISPEIIMTCQNVCDDVNHAVKASTSLHLAENIVNHRDFILGDLVDVVDSTVSVNEDSPRVFSPFGMGILDLAVAKKIIDEAQDDNVQYANDFFPEPYQI